MKTAISLPDDVFAAAEDLASRLGISRSQLYASAVARFVETMRAEGVTARLDVVYETEPSGLDPLLQSAQLSALGDEDW